MCRVTSRYNRLWLSTASCFFCCSQKYALLLWQFLLFVLPSISSSNCFHLLLIVSMCPVSVKFSKPPFHIMSKKHSVSVLGIHLRQKHFPVTHKSLSVMKLSSFCCPYRRKNSLRPPLSLSFSLPLTLSLYFSLSLLLPLSLSLSISLTLSVYLLICHVLSERGWSSLFIHILLLSADVFLSWIMFSAQPVAHNLIQRSKGQISKFFLVSAWRAPL